MEHLNNLLSFGKWILSHRPKSPLLLALVIALPGGLIGYGLWIGFKKVKTLIKK